MYLGPKRASYVATMRPTFIRFRYVDPLAVAFVLRRATRDLKRHGMMAASIDRGKAYNVRSPRERERERNGKEHGNYSTQRCPGFRLVVCKGPGITYMVHT